MTAEVHNPTDRFGRVVSCYKRAQIDYAALFVSMYIAYNAWYREITRASNDREALNELKKRYIIWDDYCQGRTLRSLTPYMERIVELTQREPLISSSSQWSGELDDVKDWRSLIEYWYQVRCLIVHGVGVDPKYVWLAYESLDIFMNEIIERARRSLDEYSVKEQGYSSSEEVFYVGSEQSEKFVNLHRKLYKKYVSSPDIWQVDMHRVS